MTLPASTFVNVDPSVLSAGGNAVDLLGLILTQNTRVPIGQVLSFPNDGASVGDYFGAGSKEAALAAVYFAGFSISTKKPASLLFAQYPSVAVAAYLRGGAFGLTVAQMQALSGSLTAVMDGYSHVISSINLSGYSSFSAAAAGISAAFTDPTEASFTASLGATATGTAGSPSTQIALTSVTGLISIGDTIAAAGIPANTTILSQVSGSTGGAGTYVLSNANTASSASVTITSNVLDVTVDTDNAIAVGQTLVGSGVTGTPVITAQLGGTPGGIGTYKISGTPQEVASEAMTAVATAPVVTYDSVSGAFVITSGITGAPSTAAFATGSLAASLDLTSATGAVLSQGAAAAVPGAFMAGILAVTTDWASFMTAFDPDGGSGNAQKLLFAEWVNSTDDQYVYVAWDTDITPTESTDAAGSLGQLLAAANLSGTNANYEPSDEYLAPFVCGAIASVDYDAPNGATSFAFRGQPGLVAGVTSETVYNNLVANGYNSYVALGQAGTTLLFYQPGLISGPFKWLDDYVNQIWLNRTAQAALLNLLISVKKIPYTPAGYGLIRNVMADVAAAGLLNGVIEAGVVLSASQIAAVNAAANISTAATALQNNGWFLVVADPGPTVRAERESPTILFFWTSGESVQMIDLSSILVQ